MSRAGDRSPRRIMTADDLWALPRVGDPELSPDGRSVVVPVTTYSMEENNGTSRLYHFPAAATGVGSGGRHDPARPLTSAVASSQSPALSPDGRRLAFVRKPGSGSAGDAKGKGVGAGAGVATGAKHGDVTQLYVMPLDGGEPERLTDFPLGISVPRWFPDGRRIAFISEVYIDAPTIEGTAKRHQERQDDPVKAAVTEDRVYRVWDRWITDRRTHHIFAVDLVTREIMDLTPRWRLWMSYMDLADAFRIAPNGREIAFASCRTEPPYDPVLWGVFTVTVPSRIGARAKAGAIRSLAPREAANATDPVYSPDGRFILYGMQREWDFYADRVRVVAYDRSTRRHTVLTETWDRSAMAYRIAADSRTVVILAETEARTAFFTLDLPAAIRNPKASRPREILRGGSFGSPRLAGGRIFCTRSALTSPPEVVSCDLRGKDLRVHTAFTAPILKNLQLGEVDEFIFDGAGGRPVQMFVVYPVGYRRTGARRGRLLASGRAASRRSAGSTAPAGAAGRLPLVQLVHGGPHGTFGDGWHWRWNAQVFSGGRYAVAKVNFHGSTSWGQAFAASILGRWGDQPFDDVMRATDALIAEGLVDPNRMAVAGGSYGGYLVAWIASQTDRFRCAINHAGVSDLQTQYASDFTQGRRRSLGGEPWSGLENVDRYNPLRHADGFRTPMLVLHGEKDYRVPYVEGLQIYNVYKGRKLPARLVVYPDENHWILKPRNSRHWYGEFTGWLDRWIGKGSGAATRRAGRGKS